MLRAAGIAALALTLVTACSAPSAPVASLTPQPHGVPAGWQVVSRQGSSNVTGVDKAAGEGFRIALPPGWAVHEVDRARMLDRYRAASAALPTGSASYSEADFTKWIDSHKLLATGATEGADPVMAELQIHSLWIDAAVNLSNFERDQRAAYERDLGAVLVSSKRTKLGTQEAQVMHLRFKTEGHQLWLTAFLLLRAREVWSIEFYGPFDGIDRLSPVFDEIAATFLFI